MEAGVSTTEIRTMRTAVRFTIGCGAALIAAACTDFGTPSSAVTGSLAAFQSVPAGFSPTSSSFAAGGDLGDAFQPHRGDGSFDFRGPGGPAGDGDHDGGGRGRGDGFGF